MSSIKATLPCEKHLTKKELCPECDCCKGCVCICSSPCSATHANPADENLGKQRVVSD